MLNKKIKLGLLLATYSCVSIAVDDDKNLIKNELQVPNSQTTIELDEVEVKAKRRRIITPLPGVPIGKATATTNIQSATSKEIEETKALNVTEFMNGNMQSVTINDYAGNPFQQDLNFRGFTASPMIGTPQGISVYLDGVRINEAFGEVVNWDLIPMNAIASLNMIPGSNPLFGLNTIGGALALRTKDGFSDNYLRVQYLNGSWGREQFQLSNGIHNDRFALFTAYNHFQEDGWRDNSPSNIRQLFNKATVRFDKGELNLTAINVDNTLVGNGVLPFEMAEVDRKQVFTSPDEVKNSLAHYNLSGSWYVNDEITISGLLYHRNMKQSGIGADVYDAYARMLSAWSGVLGPARRVNGLFNYTDLDQSEQGFSLQAAFDLQKHQLVLGMSFDTNSVDFLQSQQLAQINTDHSLSLVADPIFGVRGFFPAYMVIDRNDLSGSSKTKSIFLFDNWSISENVQVSLGGRFNWTNVKNNLRSDTGKEFYNFTNNDLLPERQVCLVEGDVSPTRGRFVCSKGDYDYRSFNPSVGLNWDLKEAMSAYANISRGSRTPTVIELGCANDPTKSSVVGSTNFQYGCSIPTSLTSDPYLKQVRSTSYEIGFRGESSGLEWNVGAFRTELKDDILFVPLGRRNRGVFDNFGATLRQGVEMGLKGGFDNDKFSINYTWMRATFESPARIVNDANSANGSTVAANAAQAYIYVQPGDQLPGMPNHILQANWNHRFNERFDATLSMVMHSFSFVRGNENNEHESRAATNAIVAGSNRDPYDYIGQGYIPGYAIFNLRANYKWRPGVNVFLKVDNIFDREYSTAGVLGRTPFNSAGQFQTNTNDWNNTTFIGPGAPRAAWIGLSLDWDWKSRALKD